MEDLYSSTIKYISPEHLKQLINRNTTKFTVIDVRDSDFKYCHISTSLNYPSRYFHEEQIHQLIDNCPQSHVFIFHCMRSQNRGPKCAKRFIRYYFKNIIKPDFSNIQNLPKVYILKGGFKKWYEMYGDDQALTVPIE